MAYTDEELREMLLMTNIELSRLTEKNVEHESPCCIDSQSSTYNIDKRR